MLHIGNRLYLLIATIGFSMSVSGCSDRNNNIPLTMDGWRDVMIGASATTIEQYIDENTLSYDYGRCKSLQIIKDLPRASSLYVDKSTNKIISIGIGGVAKVKTLHGIDLDNTLEEVRNIIGPEHKFIPNAEYTGHPIKRENMGDLVIVWADPKKPGTNHEASRGIRFETWRSSPGLSSIEVGEFMANGDTVCDL